MAMQPMRDPMRLLSGWGGTPRSSARVTKPHSAVELERLFPEPRPRGIIARGLGRSYGDAAQRAGGTVIDMTAVDDFTLDPESGNVTAAAGASLDELMRSIVPRGWFVPVTPGTRYVTVGGAIAADVHGKNHHVAGSWSNHVLNMELILSSGETVFVDRDNDADLFWATVGGMGLTGVISRATFRCESIETSRILVATDRASDLDTVMDLMSKGDDSYDYSVAWIDLMARGRNLGRSVLTRGAFARLSDLPQTDQNDPLAYGPPTLASVPPGIPSGLLNKLTIRAFNELWFRKAPAKRIDELQSIADFFHPLDMIDRWNRLYGPRGFIQWQFVIPFGAEETLRSIVTQLSTSHCTSFLAVLKRLGPPNPGMLSFPISGWTLALDIPVGVPDLGQLLDQLDIMVAEAGGRIYLAKDSSLRAELLPAMYPRLGEWQAVRDRVDPQRRLSSDLSMRLGL